MHLRASIAFPALLLASLLMAGCYTVLIHPSVRSDEEYARASIYWQDNCLKCHDAGEVEYFYSEIDRDGRRVPGRLDTPWIYGPYSAFNYPWWFDSEWILSRHSRDYEQSEKERTDRSAGRANREGAGQIRSGSTRGAVSIPAGGNGGGTTRDSRQGAVNTTGGSGSDTKSSSGSDTQVRSRDASTGGQNQGDSSRNAGSSGNSATPARSGSTRGK